MWLDIISNHIFYFFNYDKGEYMKSKKKGSVLSDVDKSSINGELDELKMYASTYYNGTPLISDEEYDERLKSFKENYDKTDLDVDKEIKSFLISDIKDMFEHLHPMLGLRDLHNLEDVEKWLTKLDKKYGKLKYYITSKYDGLACSVVVKGGIIRTLATRGDYYKGNNITNKLHMIKGLPNEKLKVNDTLDVRGELIVDTISLQYINAERLKRNQKPYGNRRSAASGIINGNDEYPFKPLTFMLYGIEGYYPHINLIDSNISFLNALRKVGFNMPSIKGMGTGTDEVINVLKQLGDIRIGSRIPYDGLVIAIDKRSICSELGTTDKYPKWACAYKLPPLGKPTYLTDVEYNVGMDGRQNPTGIIKPVIIDNVSIDRVNLFNYNYMINLGLKIGSEVRVVRSGDVIPLILEVLPSSGITYELPQPTRCVACNERCGMDNLGYVCNNMSCEGSLLARLTRFCDVNHMNIKTLGKKTLELLIKHKVITSYIDIITLTETKLRGIPTFTPNKIRKLLNNIKSIKGAHLYRLLGGLGIKNFGIGSAKVLIKECGVNDVNSFMSKVVECRGDNSFIVNYLRINRNEINDLINIISPTISDETNGKTVVITGKFSIPRLTIISLLENKGYVVKDKVTKNTNYILHDGLSTTSTKYKDAVRFKTKVMNINNLIREEDA